MNTNNDASTNSGIISVLNQMNAMFEPAARLASHPGNPPGHDDPEDEPDEDDVEEDDGTDDHREIYDEDHDDTPTSNYHREY